MYRIPTYFAVIGCLVGYSTVDREVCDLRGGIWGEGLFPKSVLSILGEMRSARAGGASALVCTM